jgi:hypothetical protein
MKMPHLAWGIFIGWCVGFFAGDSTAKPGVIAGSVERGRGIHIKNHLS